MELPQAHSEQQHIKNRQTAEHGQKRQVRELRHECSAQAFTRP